MTPGPGYVLDHDKYSVGEDQAHQNPERSGRSHVLTMTRSCQVQHAQLVYTYMYVHTGIDTTATPAGQGGTSLDYCITPLFRCNLNFGNFGTGPGSPNLTLHLNFPKSKNM